MSYSCPDQSDRLIELLMSKGYKLHHGNGYDTAPIDIELPELDPDRDPDGDRHDPEIHGIWFTWSRNGTDVEVGETYDDELPAWSDAMEHWFENAVIPTHDAGDAFERDIGG